MPPVSRKRYRLYGARPGSGRGGPMPAWLRWPVVVLLVVIGAGAVHSFVGEARVADWSVAGPVWAPYVVGSLVAAVLLALALHRWTTSGFFRTYLFGGYLSLYLAWALMVVPLTGTVGLQLAEVVQCHRTDGVVVQAHYVRTSVGSGGRYGLGDRSSWVGEYTVDGTTYDLVIGDELDVYRRQVVMADPDGEITDRDVTRSYQVAWVGSVHACATGNTSDFWSGFWALAVGPWLALGPILAALGVRRRLRRTDESDRGARSQSA